MADIKFLSGNATNVAETESGFIFRIDSKPVRFLGILNLSEGDEVKVAGYYKRGELRADAVKNITTGGGYFEGSEFIGHIWFMFFAGLLYFLLFWDYSLKHISSVYLGYS